MESCVELRESDYTQQTVILFCLKKPSLLGGGEFRCIIALVFSLEYGTLVLCQVGMSIVLLGGSLWKKLKKELLNV